MEDLEQEQPQEVKLIVTEEMRSYIYETSKWAKFLSIIGFILSGFLLIASFGIGAVMSSNAAMTAQLGPLAALGSIGITLIYLILALLYFYPSLLLFRFANKSQQAVLFGEQAQLNDAMGHMKSLFKFWGIATIVIMISYFLFILLVAGTMMRS